MLKTIELPLLNTQFIVEYAEVNKFRGEYKLVSVCPKGLTFGINMAEMLSPKQENYILSQIRITK